jgi:hypothetical protein
VYHRFVKRKNGWKAVTINCTANNITQVRITSSVSEDVECLLQTPKLNSR